VSVASVEEDEYLRHIWLSDADGTRAVSDGPADTSPRWSPDGARMAFLRKPGDDTKPQVAVVDLATEETRILTDFVLGVEAVEWAPDGSHLVAVAVTYTEEWSDLDDDERSRRPKRITRTPFRFDNRGSIHDRRRHLWLVDPEGNTGPRCLTPGDANEEAPAWAPDGRTIAFVTDRDQQQGLVSGNDIFEVEVESGAISRAFRRGMWSMASYRSDGVLHALGNENPGYPVNGYLVRREADGSTTNLTGHLDRSSVSLAAGPANLVWRDQNAIIGYEDSGMFGVISVDPDGQVTTLIDGQKVVTGFDATGERLASVESTWDSPGEVFVDGEMITSLQTDDLDLVEPEHFRIESGGFEVDVWVYLPAGNHRVPLLLNIHGGPASQYGFGFFDEFQMYVGAGHGVVACNPRGSAGRGEAYVEAVKGQNWGVVDLADIRAAIDEAIARYPRLDTDRMGVMGGSYGGFMTAWMTGLEDRWKSAVVERALLSWTSFDGTSDIGGVFSQNYLSEAFPDSWGLLWEKSPLSLVHQVSTPTLILHAEDDHRCPIEQAEQYFTGLLRNGTHSELLRFPAEGHEMSRSGKPLHRKERFEAVLDWHDEYLKQ